MGLDDCRERLRPAVAPDGRVAYVGSDGQVWVAAASEGLSLKPVRITFGADHPAHPAWSPDGTRVAFGTRTDVESVAADVPPGATANPTRQEDPKPGVPSYQRTALAPAVLAFDGADPVSEAVSLSQAGWTDYRSAYRTAVAGASGAVLVPADAPSGVLTAAAVFAGESGLALYPVSGGTVDPRVTAELTRLFGQHDKRTFGVVYFGPKVPDGVAAAVTAATGRAPVANTSDDVYGMDFLAEGLHNQDNLNHDPGATGTAPAVPAPLTPATVTLVVADDDRPALLAALGVVAAAQNDGSRDYRIVLTKGSTMPDAAKPILNAVKGQQVVAIGAHGAAALASSWTGKPVFKATTFTGATPAALAETVAKNLRSVAEAGSPAATLTTAAVLPVPTDATWSSELLMAAAGTGPVLFSDSGSALGAGAQALLKPTLAALIHVATIGDGKALATNLGTELGAPLPFPVLTDPKAPAAAGN
ncbi:TolB family protein [Catenulispora yoronensis]